MNPINKEGFKRKAENIGRIALYEMLSRKFGGITPDTQKLMNKYPTYLYPKEYIQEEIMPQFADKLTAKNIDAINVGYDPTKDKLGLGDTPPVGSIFSSNSEDTPIQDVLPHEFIHRYQYEHPLVTSGFVEEASKTPDLKGLLSFILGRYSPTQVPSEMMAYATEGKIPENLKRFYKGLYK